MPLNYHSSRAQTPAHATAGSRHPYALLALAVLCWAGNFVAGRGLRDEAPPVALTFFRWTVALAVLAPFTFSHLRGRWALIRRSWKILCLLALFATVLQHIPIYWGLRDTTATNAALLNATSPIFIALLSVLLLHQRLNVPRDRRHRRLLLRRARHREPRQPRRAARIRVEHRRHLDPRLGDVVGRLHRVPARRPAELRGLDLLTLIAAISVGLLAPLCIVEVAAGRVLVPTAAALGGIAYVGVVASVLAYIAWNHGVAQIGPARAGPFMYLMLVFTPVLSIVFLGERLEPFHFAGAGLIIAGIYLTTLRERRARPVG